MVQFRVRYRDQILADVNTSSPVKLDYDGTSKRKLTKTLKEKLNIWVSTGLAPQNYDPRDNTLTIGPTDKERISKWFGKKVYWKPYEKPVKSNIQQAVDTGVSSLLKSPKTNTWFRKLLPLVVSSFTVLIMFLIIRFTPLWDKVKSNLPGFIIEATSNGRIDPQKIASLFDDTGPGGLLKQIADNQPLIDTVLSSTINKDFKTAVNNNNDEGYFRNGKYFESEDEEKEFTKTNPEWGSEEVPEPLSDDERLTTEEMLENLMKNNEDYFE